MKLFVILTGTGVENYILATDEQDAIKYYSNQHIMDVYQVSLKVTIKAANILHGREVGNE